MIDLQFTLPHHPRFLFSRVFSRFGLRRLNLVLRVIKDGVRYHHIFDSHTGYPAEAGLSSVTVISSSGSDSDALSTACFALGYDKSLSLLKKYNAEAIFIDNQGNILLTDGIQNNFTSY